MLVNLSLWEPIFSCFAVLFPTALEKEDSLCGCTSQVCFKVWTPGNSSPVWCVTPPATRALSWAKLTAASGPRDWLWACCASATLTHPIYGCGACVALRSPLSRKQKYIPLYSRVSFPSGRRLYILKWLLGFSWVESISKTRICPWSPGPALSPNHSFLSLEASRSLLTFRFTGKGFWKTCLFPYKSWEFWCSSSTSVTQTAAEGSSISELWVFVF